MPDELAANLDSLQLALRAALVATGGRTLPLPSGDAVVVRALAPALMIRHDLAPAYLAGVAFDHLVKTHRLQKVDPPGQTEDERAAIQNRIEALVDDLLVGRKCAEFAGDDESNALDRWALIQYALGKLEPHQPQDFEAWVADGLYRRFAAGWRVQPTEVFPALAGTCCGYDLDNAALIYAEWFSAQRARRAAERDKSFKLWIADCAGATVKGA